MYKLITKIRNAIEKIEDEKGTFKIKSLVAQDLDNIKWDLVLSADWFEYDEMKRLDYLVTNILSDLDTDSLVQFSAMITYKLEESNSLIDLLTTIQENNRLGLYPDSGGYVLVEPRHEIAKWVIPLNKPEIATNVTRLERISAVSVRKSLKL